MKKIFWLFACICFFSAVAVTQSPALKQDGYKLVWSDEFDKEGTPDTAKWNFETGFVRNNEMQWYQKENATCKNGYLVIKGERENRPNPNFVHGSTNWKTNRQNIRFTAASVVMKKEHAFLYGKVEVRAKIDAQKGLWPAIWTLGVSGQWPSNGEVDIMEYYDNRILANYAWATEKKFTAIWDGASVSIDSLGGKDWASEFHTWTLLWDEMQMQIFVDDQLVNATDLSKTINQSDGKNPMKQPHYLLLNLAMGGNRGGSLAETRLPSEYLVDYVRIYQKQ
jgi:beta-glucanase (GH16 family)